MQLHFCQYKDFSFFVRLLICHLISFFFHNNFFSQNLKKELHEIVKIIFSIIKILKKLGQDMFPTYYVLLVKSMILKEIEFVFYWLNIGGIKA